MDVEEIPSEDTVIADAATVAKLFDQLAEQGITKVRVPFSGDDSGFTGIVETGEPEYYGNLLEVDIAEDKALCDELAQKIAAFSQPLVEKAVSERAELGHRRKYEEGVFFSHCDDGQLILDVEARKVSLRANIDRLHYYHDDEDIAGDWVVPITEETPTP
jgi:hypothetical protein